MPRSLVPSFQTPALSSDTLSLALLDFDRSSKPATAGPQETTISDNKIAPASKSSALEASQSRMQLLDASLRYGLYFQAVFAIIGFSVFVANFVISFNIKDRLYRYSCPLSAMWMGLATMWYTVLFILWWLLAKARSTLMLKIWIGISALFALEGFIALVSFASSKNEGAAAGLSLLWIASGILGVCVCVAQKREAAYRADEHTALGSGGSEEKRGGWTRCCTAQCCLSFSLLFIVAWLLVFSTGVTVQSAAAAHDANALAPPGRIYTINLNGTEVELHLYCFGETAETTVVLEHGGGSNSMAMLGLAGALVDAHGVRACVYDRKGYGFSPTLYTGSERLPNSGVMLSLLLDKAGEAGPFVCAGHSAGAEACLWFARHNKQVRGVAMLDGYPDLIRAGAFRPGQPPSRAILGATQAVAVIVGAPGLARGLVGDPGSDFTPADKRGTVTALYGQTRFWLAQHWDLKADFDTPEDRLLYRQLDGSKNDQGLVHYGGSLQGVKVLVVPAANTVNKTCEGGEASSPCCGSEFSSSFCSNQRADALMYLEQAQLYASSLSADVNGTLVVAPPGSAHDFVWRAEFIPWIVSQIADHLL